MARSDDSRIAWSQVPVGPEAARDRLAGCEPREVAVLEALAAQRYLTLDQITRVFYSAERTARTRLYELLVQRLVCRFDRTPWMGRAVGYTRRPPWVFFLDWNGKYALEGPAPGVVRGRGRPGRRLTWWRADRIAQPSAAMAHQLGVNEVWSYLLGAARSTYRPARNGIPRPTLQVGWHNEGAALVRYGAGATQVVRPDAEIHLRLVPPAAAGAGTELVQPPDWVRATLDERSWAPPAEAGAEDPGGVRERTLLLEFETGAHHEGAVIAKVQGYNTLFQTAATWQPRYGARIPRIVVVVRDDGQVADMVAIWRAHYFMARLVKAGSAACPVLVSSLAALKRAAQGGPAGVLGPCWVHALDPEARPVGTGGRGPGVPCRVLTFGEALGVSGV